VGQQVHRTQARSPLTRWQIEYGAWLAQQGKRPKRPERLATASLLRNKHRDRDTHPDELPPLTLSKLRWLEGTEEFHALVDRYVAGGIDAAQAYLRAYYPTLASLHVWAAVRAQEKDDVRAMAALTVPPMDRYEPKKSEAPMIPANITINLTEQQLKSFTAPPAAIDATALIQGPDGRWFWPDGRPVTELPAPQDVDD